MNFNIYTVFDREGTSLHLLYKIKRLRNETNSIMRAQFTPKQERQLSAMEAMADREKFSQLGITASEFMKMNGCSSTTAHRVFWELCASGVCEAGEGTHPVYYRLRETFLREV